MDPIAVLSRWIHIFSAIALMGGAIFAVLAVIPTLAGVDEEIRKQIKAGIRSRWAKVVHIGIVLLLLTGFYNYLMVIAPDLQEDDKGLYHALMGTKILIALVVFFFASVLAGKSAKFEAMRQQDRKWLSIVILLAGIVVAIGGFLKIAVPPSAENDVEETRSGTPSAVDNLADSSAESPATEPTPSAVARGFELNALAKDVANPVLGAGYSVNIDRGRGVHTTARDSVVPPPLARFALDSRGALL